MYAGGRRVKDADSSTHAYLLASYGPLLTRQNLADLMPASPNGLCVAIARQRHPRSIARARARRRVGRRIDFEARRVANAIDAEQHTSEAQLSELRVTGAGG